MIGATVVLFPSLRITAVAASSGLDSEVKRDIVPFMFGTVEAAGAQDTAVV